MLQPQQELVPARLPCQARQVLKALPLIWQSPNCQVRHLKGRLLLLAEPAPHINRVGMLHIQAA